MNLFARPELRIVACLVAVGLSAHALWLHTPAQLSGTANAGVVGHAIAVGLIGVFGRAAWLVPLLFAELARRTLCHRPPPLAAMAGLLCLACTILGLVVKDAGGQLGSSIANGLLQLFGAGAYLICGSALVLATLFCAPPAVLTTLTQRMTARVLTAWRAATALERADHAARSARAARLAPEHLPLLPSPRPPPVPLRPNPASGSTAFEFTDAAAAETLSMPPAMGSGLAVSDAPGAAAPARPVIDLPPPASFLSVTSDVAAEAAPNITSLDAADAVPAAEPTPTNYELPSAALLAAPPLAAAEVDEQRLKKHAKLLEDKLAGFGVIGRVDGIHPGPVVTMYEYEPQGGTKLSKIAALSDDLSMALQSTVRVVAPIPGTARVGFEVPNELEHREIVCLRELVEDERWTQLQADLPVVLGKDIGGQPVYADLALMPHLLVAGATGAGKSVGLNALLASLLMRLRPQNLRLVLIDPKAVELAGFEGVPHLLLPVVTETTLAARALQWAVQEMERRYSVFRQCGVRNLHGFNALAEKPRTATSASPSNPISHTPLPRILVVVDEFADLMMVTSADAEEAIARLAQKGRASGIHVIVATQRPSVDVITGTIKANFNARIAYRVVQREDSKTILGRTGAQHLLGLGDMLCQLPYKLDLQRVHGAHISDEELKDICDYLRAQARPVYDATVLQSTDEETPTTARGRTSRRAANDELFDRAVQFVAQQGYCSVSAVQRGLEVGYNRAAKLVDRMEAAGIVGPPSAKAGGRRDVFVEAQ